MFPAVASLLAAIGQIPGVDSEIDCARGAAEARVGAWVIARIDLERNCILVTAPRDAIPTLHRLCPSSRATTEGIALDLVDPQGWSEALAAVRRRAHVQRLIWQYRAASP
jgi:hypothetical protein